MEDTMILTDNCKFCNCRRDVEVPIAGFLDWAMDDELIQKAMPNVSESDREFLVSGICPTCWEKMFGEN